MAEEKKKTTKKKESALEIYVGQDKMALAKLVDDQVRSLSMLTPQKYIMQREGPGKIILDYVETNYVIGRLNAAFMFDWDSEIMDKIVDRENRQIALLVRLTVRFADGKVVKKDAWGGSDIKMLTSGKGLVDFANDLKGAESDGIKKAASMLGLCWDVYSGLTPSGKKSKQFNDDKKANGLTTPPETTDRENQFRTIPIKIGDKIYLHTKYEALDRFKEAKKNLGEEVYYKVLGEHGFVKSNEIQPNELPEIYYAMVEAYKASKIKTIDAEVIEEQTDEALTKANESMEVLKKASESRGFSTEEIEKDGEKEPVPEEKEESKLMLKPEDFEKPEIKEAEASQPRVTEEPVFPEAEAEAEFKPPEKIKEKATEMPLRAEIMSLAGLEAMLVDKHKFTPDQICEQLKKMCGEDELIKLTRKQTVEAIAYFKKEMERLDKEKAKE